MPTLTSRFKIYRRHNCSARHRLYRRMASCIWRRAVWIHGDGPYACVAYCRVTTVQLSETFEEAQIWKGQIDWFGCGGFCNGRHEVIEMLLPEENT